MTKVSFPLLLLLFSFYRANAQDISYTNIPAKKINNYSIADSIFKKYTILNIPANELAAITKNKTSITFRLRIDTDKIWDISLEPSGITANAYRLLLQTENGLQAIPSKPDYIFKGRINSQINTSVRMLIREKYFTASFFINDEEYFIEPLSNYDKKATNNLFVFYNSKDVIAPKNFNCPVTKKFLPALSKPQIKPGTPASALCYTIPIVLMADYQLLQQFQFNIDSLEAFLLGNMYEVQGIFSGFDLDAASANDTGDDKMQMQVINCVISTCNTCDLIGKTMEGSNLIRELDAKVKGNPDYPFYYITNYWTPRNLFNVNQGIGGISSQMPVRGNKQPPAACDYYGANILRYASSNRLLLRFIAAHEMGHSFGCQHDNEINSSVRQFIMNASAANPGASRFSRLSDFGGGHYSSSLRIKQQLNYVRDCLAGCENNTTICPPLTSIAITNGAITNNGNITISWNETKECSVRLLLQQKDSLIIQEEKTVTANSTSFSGLDKCKRYIVQVQQVCNSIPGIAVSIPVYSSAYNIDNINTVVSGNYYQLKIKLNKNALTGTSLFFIDNFTNDFSYDASDNLITVSNLFADGRRHKIEIKDINGTDTCYLSDTYIAPYGRKDATVLLASDFNNCGLAEGWKDSIVKYNPISGYKSNKWHYANFSTPVLRTLVGTIDSTCMMYYNTFSPDNGCCGSLQITSPVKDISNYKNTILSFDYAFDAFKRNLLAVHSGFRFEVFNGVDWIKVFELENTQSLRPPFYLRNVWDTIPPRVFIPIDIYRNNNFQVRLILEDGVVNNDGQFVTGNLLAAFDNIKVDGYLSNTANSDENFSVYPNPAADKIFVSLNLAVNTNVQYTIFDSKGALISKGKLVSNNINTSFLSTGLYYLKLIKSNTPVGKPTKLIIHK